MPVKFKGFSVTVDSAEPQKSADFYAQLMGWKIGEAYGFPLITDPSGNWSVLFSRDDFQYEPPVWPEQAGKQQKQMHFDIMVEDLAVAIELAESLGGKKAPEQYLGDHGVAMLDPEGRVFDLLQA